MLPENTPSNQLRTVLQYQKLVQVIWNANDLGWYLFAESEETDGVTFAFEAASTS